MGIHHVDRLMTAERNLELQTEIVSNARAFVGTYGGLAYLATFYGVPSIAFYSTQAELLPAHMDVWWRLSRLMGVPASAIDTRATDVLRTVLDRSLMVALIASCAWSTRSVPRDARIAADVSCCDRLGVGVARGRCRAEEGRRAGRKAAGPTNSAWSRRWRRAPGAWPSASIASSSGIADTGRTRRRPRCHGPHRTAAKDRRQRRCARASRLPERRLPGTQALLARRFRGLSQHEEDGITVALFDRIGAATHRFVEIGAGVNGGNSGFLAKECGWTGADDRDRRRPRREPAATIRAGRVRRRGAGHARERQRRWWTTNGCRRRRRPAQHRHRRHRLLGVGARSPPAGPASSSSNTIRSLGADRAIAIPYDPQFNRHTFDVPRAAYYGASLPALVKLGARKGYRLVLVEPRGVNAFFVRDDIASRPSAAVVSTTCRLRPRRRRGLRTRRHFPAPRSRRTRRWLMIQ